MLYQRKHSKCIRVPLHKSVPQETFLTILGYVVRCFVETWGVAPTWLRGGGCCAYGSQHPLIYYKSPPVVVHFTQTLYLYLATGLADCPGGSFRSFVPRGDLLNEGYSHHYNVVSQFVMYKTNILWQSILLMLFHFNHIVVKD